MHVAVYLPFVLPLTALPVARLATDHLHPRRATLLLTAVSAVLAACSTLCLALLMVVGTAQVPGNPLPDGWADPEVREAVPHVRLFGTMAIAGLAAVVVATGAVLARETRVRRRARAATEGLARAGEVAILPDDVAYAYALPGAPRRIVVSTGMLACLTADERRALIAHERAHLTGHHHRYLLVARLAAAAQPFLRPLHTAIAYTVERWADEEAAAAVGDRRTTAHAVGKAALAARRAPTAGTRGGHRFGGPHGLPAFAATPGPVPRRVAALLGPTPDAGWPAPRSRAGLAALVAAAGTTVSVVSASNATIALFVILKAATAL
ncbi:M56 family metallopeptidase [Yinghuangia seranimata]|uniref:M56 family metallopeptidase n=1 Tax=Yinghuangia seranimata TaxID=408067 RepID=UPI00248CD137|nr:M56 family metallopeptidase [Yinghuangia seranimata]MDI2126162.1 M56 family metallopeptidase [Yinghuangia seranimata]